VIVAYIPRNARWYVAEIVEEIRVEGDERNVVHRILVLVDASSPEDAYRRAMELGQQSELTWQNPKGRTVVSRFRGLSELDVVHDPLEHGAELCFFEDISVPEERVAAWVRNKERLNVFREIEPSTGPDYSCKEVVEEARRLASRNSQNQD
jgi:hypothetical protein